jgi:hypothetical protein
LVSVITAISGLVAGLHIKKSKCFGNECFCESEETKINRIKTVIDRNYSRGDITPVSKNISTDI